jgi:hypothetical protein
MPVTINGNGSITGLSVGGLPNGTVDADTLATDAVTTDKILNLAVTPAKSTISGGVTHAQIWRRGSFSGAMDPITGLTKYTSTNNASVGADMTESSGIFTFPTTGIWYIKVQGYLYKNSFVGSATITIDTTTNNSNYSGTGNTYWSHVTGTGGTQYSHTINTMMFDVTDTSQCKCSFRAVGSAGQWDSAHVEFIRLGDT